MTRRATVAAAAALTLTLAGVASAAPAWAHSYLVDSTPAEGAVLTELPAEFSVTANETLLDLGGQGVFALQIRDADGRYYGDGCVEVVNATMSAAAAIGPSGDYTMLWQVVSADGHPVSGEIPFSWEAPEGFDPSPALDRAPACGEDPDGAPATGPAVPSEPGEIPGEFGGGSIGLWIAVGIILFGAVAAVIGVAVAFSRKRDPEE